MLTKEEDEELKRLNTIYMIRGLRKAEQKRFNTLCKKS